MSRNNLTELVLIIEKNNPITQDPKLLQDLLKYQSSIPKLKLTLHVFDDKINYHAIDFKNIKDINLSPLNNNNKCSSSLVYEAITDTVKKVNHRNSNICTCRMPERIICIIIVNNAPINPEQTVEMPYHPWTSIVIKPSVLNLNIKNAEFINYIIDGNVSINSPEQIIVNLNKLILDIRKTASITLPEKII